MTKLTSGKLTRDKTQPPETWHVTKFISRDLTRDDTHCRILETWPSDHLKGRNQGHDLNTWLQNSTQLQILGKWPLGRLGPRRNQGHDLNTWLQNLPPETWHVTSRSAPTSKGPRRWPQHVTKLTSGDLARDFQGLLRPRRARGHDLNTWQNSPPETWHVTSRSAPTSKEPRSWP